MQYEHVWVTTTEGTVEDMHESLTELIKPDTDKDEMVESMGIAGFSMCGCMREDNNNNYTEFWFVRQI